MGKLLKLCDMIQVSGFKDLKRTVQGKCKTTFLNTLEMFGNRVKKNLAFGLIGKDSEELKVTTPQFTSLPYCRKWYA